MKSKETCFAGSDFSSPTSVAVMLMLDIILINFDVFLKFVEILRQAISMMMICGGKAKRKANQISNGASTL